jgi:hypothetical protein
MSPEKTTEEPSYLNYKGKYKGIFSWIFSTDHKRIGLLYLFSILTFFIIGATLGLLMKFELIAPGGTIMDAQSYNAFFTLHGIVMIFAVVIPGLPAGHRLDILCTLQLQDYQYTAPGGIWCIRPWIFINSYRVELSGHYPQDARPGNDLVKNAIIPLVALCHRMGTAACDSNYRDHPAYGRC